MTVILLRLTIKHAEGSDVDLSFSLKRSTLRKIPSFLSLQQPRIFHEYCLCILAMITMSRKDLKHVNQPSLAVHKYL